MITRLMRLDVDLSFDAVPGRVLAPGAAAAMDLHSLAALLHEPGRLWTTLRATSYDEVRLNEGTLPLSAVQAAVLLCLAFVPARRFSVGGCSYHPVRFALRAAAKLALAAPRELMHTVRLSRVVSRAAATSYDVPASAVPRRVLYLRIDPSLRWMGKQVGGAATHTSGVINGLIDNGLEVDVLAPERPAGTERAGFAAVPPRRVLQLVRGLNYTDYSEALLAAAARRSADLVYQRYQLGSHAGLELARRLGVPLVLEFNGSEIWVERHWGSGTLRLAGPLAELERRNLTAASLVVVVSEPLRRLCLELGVAPERILVNPNGVDVARLEPHRREPPEAVRRRLGLPDQPTVGFIGTFGLWHGVKLLPSLIAGVPRARWILIGDGGLRAEVEQEIAAHGDAGRTMLAGLVEHERALELLAACDVCVSPHVPNPDGTPFFGSPTKLFEYMGLGKAIVASDLDQIGEIIEHERTALLCPPGDVPAAASAVERLLDDPQLRRALGEAALRKASTDYSWAAHARRILDALTTPHDPHDPPNQHGLPSTQEPRQSGLLA